MAQDFTQKGATRAGGLSSRGRKINHTKSRVRSRVEHVFHVIKRIFA